MVFTRLTKRLNRAHILSAVAERRNPRTPQVLVATANPSSSFVGRTRRRVRRVGEENFMKDRAAIQAAGTGQQSVDSSGSSAVPPFVDAEKPRAKAHAAAPPGLSFPRFFTEAGVDPFDEVEWEIRAAASGNERGERVFEQR